MELPKSEVERLNALSQYQILDTAPEASFDDLTHLAAYICQTPIAAIGLTDEHRQWFKSKMGFLSTEELRETTFCADVILQKDLLIVSDALHDERYVTNRFVRNGAHIRFYAGAPLVNPDGFVLGTLCVLDHVPRTLNEQQKEALRSLARQVVTQLELRRNLEALEENIAERRRSEALLRHNAFHDQLTGLPNRAAFMSRLAGEIEKTKQLQNYLFAVLFVDLDRFKVVNDSLGHIVGDQLLVAIARRLTTCLRPVDMVARLGGDEFAILIDNLSSIRDATDVAERIQAELKVPFHLNGHEIFSSTSVGIALSSIGYTQPQDLLRDADTAMYRAKLLGRTRYEIFDPAMHESMVSLLQLETDLRRAIARQEFQIYYQPIILLETGKITGFEALVHWQHPTRGLVPPGDFISVAEETGAIVPLGYWVIQEACRQVQAWLSQFPAKTFTISVNISSKQFSQPDLIEQISQTLRTTGLVAKHFKLEITESVIMENAESATAMLVHLRDLGIELQLDDFGTGYSSLSYLHRFPVDGLKIDRSFISQVDPKRPCKSQTLTPIVGTILTLAQNLNVDVTAEGVETSHQLAQLKGLKCKYAQGYFFARPLDQVATAALLAADPQW